MWKSVLANIESDSPKVINAFKQLGISMTETGKNGQQQLVPVYNLILELSQKLAQHTPDTQKYFEAIAGGKYQFDTLEAAISNTDAITQAYSASVHSQGDAQKNAAMTTKTFGAQLQRLADTVQQAAFNKTNSNGLMQFLAGLISNITNFINVLGHVPTGVYEFIAVLAGLKLATSGISSVFKGLQNSISVWKNGLASIIEKTADVVLAMKGQKVATTEQLAEQALVDGANAKNTASTSVLKSAINSLKDAINAEKVAVIEQTGMQEANVAVEGEATVATGFLASAQGALATATGVATAAGRGFMAVLASIDLETGGLLLVMGAFVGIIMGVANANIQAEQAQQAYNQSLQDYINKNQQIVSDAQQSYQTTLQNIQDTQTLGQQYIDLRKQLDGLQKGTNAYRSAEDSLSVVKAKLIPLIGEDSVKKLENIKNTKDLATEIGKLSTTEMNNLLTTLEGQKTKADGDNALIETTITNTQKYINQMNQRIEADNKFLKANASTLSGEKAAVTKFGIDAMPQGSVMQVGAQKQQDLIDAQHKKDIYQQQQKQARDKQKSAREKKTSIDDLINIVKSDLKYQQDNNGKLPPDSSGDGSGSGSGSGTGTGSGSALANYKANNPDPYTAKLDDIDAKIKALQADQEKYNKTSAEYRNDLQKQIPLLEQKKQAMQDEQNMYIKQIGQLTELAKTAKTSSQKDAINNQITADQNKVHQLSVDMQNVQKNINSVGDAVKNSQLEEYFNSLNNRTAGINTNITNLKNSLDLLNSSDADNLTKSEINKKLADEYKALYNAQQQNIKSLEQEGQGLNQNSAAWATYQKELKSAEEQAHQTAQLMAQEASSTQSDLLNNLTDMENKLIQQIETQRQKDATDIKKAQSEKVVWDQTDWNSTVQTTQNDLNETISGKYQTPINFDASAQAQAMADVNTQMAQYGNSLNSVNAELQQFQGFSTDSYSAMKSQIMSEINYLSGSNGLESQLKTVNTQIANMTEEYKTQEDSLQNQITMITNSYDDQIKALQQKQSALDTEYQTEDALTNLYKEQVKVQQDLLDKHYEYIDAQGKVTYTYNKSLVSQDSLTLQKDTLTQQRDMQKQALQNQIDDLTNAKDQQTQLLQQELTNMKQIHADQLQEMKDYASNLQTLMQNINSDISDKTSQLDQMYQDQENKVTNGFDSLKSAIQNGTENISTLLYGKDGKGGWMAQMIAEAKQFGIDFGNQITSIANEVKTLMSLSGSINNQLSLENSANGIGKTINYGGKPTPSAGGASGRPIVKAFHTGGVVGSGSLVSSGMIDQLFNTAPNEQIIKALVGEVMIPPQNIAKNFIPAMKNFAGAIQQNSPQDNSRNYTFQNVTVVANDPTEFLSGIENMIRSERV